MHPATPTNYQIGLLLMPSKYCRAGWTAVQPFASKGGRKLIPVPEYAVQAEADAIVTINVRDFPGLHVSTRTVPGRRPRAR